LGTDALIGETMTRETWSKARWTRLKKRSKTIQVGGIIGSQVYNPIIETPEGEHFAGDLIWNGRREAVQVWTPTQEEYKKV